MVDTKFSKLLVSLMEASKKIGDSNNPPFTAERFLIAAIDLIRSQNIDYTAGDADGDFVLLQKNIHETFYDLENTKEALLSYISQTKEKSFMDDLYMKKKLNEASKLTGEDESDEITASILFMCIKNDPSDILKTIISKSSDSEDDIVQSLRDKADQVEINMPERQMFSFDKINEKADTANKSKEAIGDLVAEVARFRHELQDTVFGQNNAINVFVSGYFQANMLSMISKHKKGPRASFLFAGPPGVGKTLMAESIAAMLNHIPCKRFNMSEYSDKEANLEFCGSDKVYKNSKEGNVTSFVEKNPKCVLLFDEIEKAHLNVIYLFLQILDKGVLRDNNTDRDVSFADAIVIFTTNAGKQLYEENEDLSCVSRKVIIKALEKDINPNTGTPFFPAAICSRFAAGNIVMFNHIGANDLRDIAKKEFEKRAADFERETGIKIKVDDRVYTALLFAEGSKVDARIMRSRAESFFNEELYELLRLVASEKVKTGIGSIEEILVTVDLSRTEDSITVLFNPSDEINVLVFASEEIVAQCKEKAPGLNFIGAQDVKSALDIAESKDIGFVMLDMKCGAPEESLNNLNIEDVESPARDFFKSVREQYRRIPVYLVNDSEAVLSDEEIFSFERQGIRGVLQLTDDTDSFAEQIRGIATGMYQQASMERLAKENKLVTYGTSQTVSANGKTAVISLYGFEMEVAVDAEDSKNILSSMSMPNIRFNDVIGANDAKEELKYFVEYLKNPKKYKGTGVKPPKGIILYGPPGTGKTMLAKAMASEAGVTFIAAEGNEFVKRFIGDGGARVHELFRTARKYAPSVIFIDEIDAIAKERNGIGGDKEETLTAFLTEMDGFKNDPSRPVFVLAATNFDVTPGSTKSLDPALMRRFDRRIFIDLPEKNDRIVFLKKKIEENKALQISDTQLENIAIRSTGMSLAGLDSVVELALRSVIKAGSTVVTDEIFEEAFETFNGGDAKKWDESQLERVARHEAGHAFLCWHSGETPSYLTVVARGNHGGYMQHAEQEGKAVYTKNELISDIRTSLGGRAAEIVYYGEQDGISTGAASDLANATAVAKRIFCTYGMDDQFGLAVVDDEFASISGTISADIREAVNGILNEQMNEAIRLISENKDKIDLLVKELMAKNHLNGAEIADVLSK